MTQYIFSMIQNNPFLESFYKNFGIPAEAQQALLRDAEEVQFSRMEIITWEGKIEQYMYFVLSGAQRSYYVHHDKEITFMFSYEGDVSGIPESFLLQKPTEYYLQALTPSKMIRIHHNTFQQLIEKYPSIAKAKCQMVEYALDGLLKRQKELLCFTAEERFRTFMKRSAHMLQMVPQKYLASYLGISQETFSRFMQSIKI